MGIKNLLEKMIRPVPPASAVPDTAAAHEKAAAIAAQPYSGSELLPRNPVQQSALQDARRSAPAAPKNTAEYLDYVRMYDDGICELRGGLWSRTLKISDIN